MAANSKIEWTDHTFNPWIGCTKVAAGCANCYAEQFAKRYGKAEWGMNGTRVKTSESYWRQPLKWNREAAKAGKRARVFCASLADVFENWSNIVRGSKGGYLHHADSWGIQHGSKFVEHDTIAIGQSRVTLADLRRDLFALIDATPNLDWLLLTKRPENIRRMWPARDRHYDGPGWNSSTANPNYRPNVWLGTSISNQEDADRNIPELLKCRDLSPVSFLSCEPLVGPVNLRRVYVGSQQQMNINADEKIDWVIAGGESGRGARPMHPDWARGLRDQCAAAGVPFYFKQWGEWGPGLRGTQRNPAWVMYPDGRMVGDELTTDDARNLRLQQNGAEWVTRVGKAAAGRLLDGRERNEFPNV